MFDNIYTSYDDAEYIITSFNAKKIIKLLEKRILDGQETAQNYAFLANAYYARNDKLKAIKYALKAKQIDENYYYADHIIALIYIEEENIYKAEKYLENLIDKSPEDYYLTYYVGAFLYYIKGEPDIAKKYSDKFLQLSTENPNYLFLRTYIYFFVQDYKSILKYSKSTIRKIFGNIEYLLIELLLVIISLLNLLLKNETGLNLLSIFVFLLVPKEDAYSYLAEISLSNDKPKKALRFLEKACKINPSFRYFIHMAEIYVSLEEYDKAIKIYNDVLEEDSTYTQCYISLANIYLIKGDYKLALEFANKAILNNSNLEDAYFKKFAILKDLGEFEKALDILLKIEEEFPQSSNLNYYFYLIYSDLNDFKNALKHINKQLMLDRTAFFYREKTVLLYRNGYFDEAIDTAKRTLEFGEDGNLYYWLACSYEAKEEYSDALKCINKSILLGENDAWTFLHKSNILASLGKNKEAKIAYKKALELGYKE